MREATVTEPPEPYPADEHDPFLDEVAEQAAAEVLGEDTDEPPEDDELPLVDESMLPVEVALLARSSEKHTGQLRELGERVTALDEAFQTLEENLTERVNLARPSRWAWRFLNRDEAEQLWKETRWFVDDFIKRYPLPSEVSIPPCWYRHTVAVDELSDLYSSWREAYCGSNRPSTAMTSWRDRWLWPMLGRLAAYADWRECKERRKHVEPTARQDPTDADFEAFVANDLANRPTKRSTQLPWPTKNPSPPAAPGGGAPSVRRAG
jgi:hypothetical protein